jgi:hypothetical protein
MRQCRFCARWFKNKQAVRRHLGSCRPYQAIPPGQRTKRQQLFACARCVEMLGPDLAAKVTSDEMHGQVADFGGCPTCGGAAWRSAGWHRVERT